MDKELLKQELMDYAEKLGFAALKITGVEPFDGWKDIIGYKEDKDPGISHLWDNMDHDPKKLMPEARSIIVAPWPYKPYKGRFPKGIAEYSSYYREYPLGRKAIIKLGEYLNDRGFKTMANPPLPAKTVAHRAGLGYYGKNGLIHMEGPGSFISLHYILTDAKLPPDKAMGKISDCGDCELCIRACPTGAIDKSDGVNPEKCIRYHMLSSDFVPLIIRDSMGTRLLGCDICQKVCPFNNRFMKEGVPLPVGDSELFNISDILEEWPSGLKKRMDAMGQIIGKNYARAQRILSTAIILAGNRRDESYLIPLIDLLKHPHPPIRGHSAWAIGKIGSLDGLGALVTALKTEKNPKVIEEIKRATEKLS